MRHIHIQPTSPDAPEKIKHRAQNKCALVLQTGFAFKVSPASRWGPSYNLCLIQQPS